MQVFMSQRKTHKGLFKPLNPKKYNGDAKNIVYRSSWELAFMAQLDKNPDVVWWSSEELPVPYRSPVDGSFHRYFPDFVVKRKSGEIVMVEIKPLRQTKPPVKGKKNSKRFLAEQITYVTNQAKFEAATEFCADKGWRFQVLTEIDLGILI